MRVGRPPKASSKTSALGRVIAAHRVDAGMTRSALALRAGVSPNTLMKVEQGQTSDPGVFKVVALCRALSITVDDLISSVHRIPQTQEGLMTHGIVSAGYEGRSIDEFVAALRDSGVRTVADVRLNAISRKAGFSKTRLRAALEAVGINYRHMRSLGNAKENRQPFSAGRVEEGRQIFRKVLQTAEAEDSLRELAALAADHVVAVLCFEADEDVCHRQVVIEEVTDSGRVPVSALRL